MRAVNLLPGEPRRRVGASRSAPLPYLLVGILALAVVGVTALALVGKTVRDREAEIAALEQREDELAARAASLAAFSRFQLIKEARVATVTALAESRFDWERVMRELALVLPDGVWLTNLTGSVAPGVNVDGGAGISIRGDAAGPALELVGCARSQRHVAGLIAALEDVDGVTRVTAANAEKPSSAVTGTSGGGSGNCQTRSFIPRFEVVAAFDEVPVPGGALPPQVGASPGPPGTPVANPAGSER